MTRLKATIQQYVKYLQNESTVAGPEGTQPVTPGQEEQKKQEEQGAQKKQGGFNQGR